MICAKRSAFEKPDLFQDPRGYQSTHKIKTAIALRHFEIDNRYDTMAFFWKVVLLIAGFGSCVQSATHNYRPLRYTIPQPLIQAFSPRGLKVSIPHTEGIQLFAFHGNINKLLDVTEEGYLSDEVKITDGQRWTYYNATVKLRVGDKINYRIYVNKDNFGYRVRQDSFVVRYLHPVEYSVEEITTVAPEHSICEKVVLNLTQSLFDLQQEIDSLRETNDILKDLVDKDSEDARTLLVDGVTVPERNLSEIVQGIVNEKLGLPFRVHNVFRVEHGLVKFQVKDFEEKLEVLRAAKRRLKYSKFSIVY